MPKRIGNLYNEVISVNHLVEIYSRAKIGKCRRASKMNFELDFTTNILKMHNALKTNNYKPQPYNYFVLNTFKKREIYAPQFQDIIIQHAILDIIEPIFDKTLIEETHGCRKGHGIHTASNYVQKCMRKCDDNDYYLQLDIKKYFYSIDRDILKKLIEKKIKDKVLVNLICEYANIENVKSGVPIGNLLSQFFGLIYLSPLDHFIKRELKQKYYCRYVDDFIILGLKKYEIKSILSKIINFLSKELNLSLSKVKANKIKHGINFVGYRTWKHFRLVRKFCLKNFKRKVKNNKLLSVISMLGHSLRTSSYLKYIDILLKYNLNLVGFLPKKSLSKMKLALLKNHL